MLVINQKWLKTFITLVKTQHFTKTAEQLFMTQPGVSQHIKKLEQQLGCHLIIRVGKKFELTEQGSKVYDYGKSQIALEQTLVDQLQDDNPFIGECSVSMSGSLCQLVYPELVSLQTQHPELNISVESAPEHKIYQQIKNNEIGFGLVTGKHQNGTFEFKKVGEEQICLLGSKQMEPKDLNDECLMSTSIVRHPDVWHYLNLILEKNSPNVDVEALLKGPYINQIDQILLPVSKGIGITALPIHALESSKYGKSVHILNLKHVVMQSVYMVKKRNNEIPSRYDQLIKVISGCLG